VNLPAFIAAAGKRTARTSTHRDPLAATSLYLGAHGDTAEGQALRKVIRALAATSGEFAEAELWLFSTDTLTLVLALAEARTQGRYPEADWLAF